MTNEISIKQKVKTEQEEPAQEELVFASNRREFLLKALGVAGLTSVATMLPATNEIKIPREEVADVLDFPDPFPNGGILERMRNDLKRALKKPIEERKWVMVIDLQKCIGCKACTVSCISENNLPPGVVYRPVTEEEVGTFPHVRRKFLPRPCFHCEDPPCVPVCPVKATYKRPDGIVSIDYDQCIGCRYCITACPYGARTFDYGEYYQYGTPEIHPYELRPTPEYGENRVRSVDDDNVSPKGNARKCQFCLHKITNGLLPACVTTCLGGSTYFGDYNDKNSLVRELIGTDRVTRVKEELGTEPNCYYLV